MTIHHADARLSNGMRLHVASCGDPGNKLILFVHGFPEFWYEWQYQLETFGSDHYAVAPDLRGFNLSDQPKEVEKYRAKHLVEDLRLLIKHLGHSRCILVAHDWGGALAWGLAIAHPELLEKLVIINSPHPVAFARELAGNAAQQEASRYMNLLRSDKAERVLSENDFARLRAMTLDQWRRGAPDAVEDAAYREAWSRPGALTGSLNYYRASPLYPPVDGDPGAKSLQLDPAAFTVRVPTMVVWGMRDRALLPCLLEGLDKCVPDLRIERLPDASHWVMHEQPEILNALIRDFIENV